MLSIKNICKSFNRLNVLDDISFTQKKGEIIALMGKNGTGKSTLLRIIARIMKADSGTVAFKEKNLIAAIVKIDKIFFTLDTTLACIHFFHQEKI